MVTFSNISCTFSYFKFKALNLLKIILTMIFWDVQRIVLTIARLWWQHLTQFKRPILSAKLFSRAEDFPAIALQGCISIVISILVHSLYAGILSGSLLYEVRNYRSCKLFKFCLVFVWVGNQKGLLFDQQQVLLQITYAVQSRLWCRHLKFNLKLNIQGSRLWNHKSSISFSFSHPISPKSTLSQLVKTVFWTVPQNLIQDTTTRALQ